MSKNIKEKEGYSTEAPQGSTKKKGKNGLKSGIMGICMALVFVSITWSTAIVGMGTDWVISSIIMLVPQAAFGVFVLGFAFSKMFK